MSLDEKNLSRVITICFKSLMDYFKNRKFVNACEFYDEIFTKYFTDFEIYSMKINNKYITEKDKFLNQNKTLLKELSSE